MLKVTIPNLPKFQKALKKHPVLAAKELHNAFEKSLNQIVRETVPLTPIDTGRLVGSIGNQGGLGIFKVEKLRASVGTTVKYAVYVHEGFQKHTLGQRKFLETGAKKSVPAIKGFFKEAYENVFNQIAKESK